MTDIEKLLNTLLSDITFIEERKIPAIDLYMDQVTTFMDKHLKNNKRFEDDKILTKTMINNYAKNDLLPPPVKKRYSKQHVIMLIFIYYFKNFLSISDIKSILNPISDKYFDGNENLSLDEIYSEIIKMEKSMTKDIREDIASKIDFAKNSFSEATDKDKDYLHLFMLIMSLSYDVYIKKQLIESIVDEINKDLPDETSSKKKKDNK